MGRGCLESCVEKDSEVVLGLDRKSVVVISEVCIGQADAGADLCLIKNGVKPFYTFK